MEETSVLRVPWKQFSPEDVFESGQTFRFRPLGSGYAGVAEGNVVETARSGDIIEIRSTLPKSRLRDYLDLNRDYSALFPDPDPVLAKALATAPGLRVLRQEPFETLISFIISANNNIARIRGIVEAIAREAGESVGGDLYAFPSPESLARVSETRLRQLGCGYRAPYIAASSRLAADTDFDVLRTFSYEEAKKKLMSFPGVGSKVADCVALFGLGKGEAFPVDVWMERVMKQLYGFEGSRLQMEKYGREHFGEYAGIAQQFLFHYARLSAGRTGKKGEK